MFRTAFAAAAGLMISASVPALAQGDTMASGDMQDEMMNDEDMADEEMSGDAMMDDSMAGDEMSDDAMMDDTMSDDDMMMEEDTATLGPAIGQPAPALDVMTAAGDPATLDSLSGEAGTAIAFVRSLDWCPYCKKQAMELEGARAPLEEAGWSLVALSYDDPETLAGFAADKGLTYTLVSDEGSEAIRAYGLLNEEMTKGSKYWGIPHPAIVFIRADGTVAEVLHEDGYKDRPEVELVTETAERLSAGS